MGTFPPVMGDMPVQPMPEVYDDVETVDPNQEVPLPNIDEILPTETTEQTPDELALEQYEAEYPEELRKALSDTIDDLQIQQKSIREVNIMEWKQLDLYWQGFQNTYWDQGIMDWRPYEGNMNDADLTEDDIPRIANVYRALGESVIAGLSAAVPGVRFSPDDADNPDDISTAKAYSKISSLIANHNNASYMIIKMLFTLFNQSFVACYNYRNESEAFGTVKVPHEIEKEIQKEHYQCLNCSEDMGPVEETPEPVCPICLDSTIPATVMMQEKELITTYEECPKAKEIIEIYGPLNVQVPFYASDLANCPYLILETEHHSSLAKALFPYLADKIAPNGSYESYERWGRQPTEAYGDEDVDIVTFRRVWLRSWAYYAVADKDTREMLQKNYPNGCYFLFLNDIFAEACEENMDDHWTISKSPTSNYLHAPPIGRTIKDVQDMTNDMVNLTLQTIEYGVPQTFVDSNAIDWDKYKQTPSLPGMMYPIKVNPNMNASAMFHTVKTAVLSQEVGPFQDRLEKLGQFLSGAFPSIFGGTQQGGSNTFKEYESSRNQALQRLSLIWKTLNILWKDCMFKACKEYAKNLKADESYTKRNGESYINVWIKKAEMQGKVGDVEAESSDQFPMSDIQRRELFMAFLTLNNEVIQSMLFHPENLGTVARVMGFGQLYVPGEDQRNKQLVETIQLMVTEPNMPQVDPMTQQPLVDPATGQPSQETSSIPIQTVDDDAIHYETTRAFLVSDPGMYLQQTNPAGYRNVELHMLEHQMRMQMAQMAEQAAAQQNEGNDERPSTSGE